VASSATDLVDLASMGPRSHDADIVESFQKTAR
jgi:hypothetical protein